MKKIVISIGLCLVGFVSMAQNVDEVNNAAYVSKRGVYLLPQAGDFAIGIDVDPFLTYLGSFFSNYGNTAPDLSSQTIYGKYFLDDNRAVRAKLMLGLFNAVNKGFVLDNAAFVSNPATDRTVVDIERTSGSEVLLQAGYEFRRGNGRVQGFYGGEIVLGYGGGKVKYDYGNRMTAEVKAPLTYDFYSSSSPQASDYRPTEIKLGKTFLAGLGAFAGVEYFFAPQLSLGCELGLGFVFENTGQNKATIEEWNYVADRREVNSTKNQSGDSWSNYGTNARNLGGGTYTTANLFLLFHF